MRLLRFASVSMLAAAATVTALRTADAPAEQHVFGQPGTVEPLAHPDGPSLNDLLATDRSVSIFASYFRDSKLLSARLVTPGLRTTIFAPVDRAITQMARMPHRGQAAVDRVTIESEKSAEAYLSNWVSRHVSSDDVPKAKRLPATLSSLVDGAAITLAAEGDSIVVGPGSAKVLARKDARDGVLLVLDSVLEYSE